MIGDEGRLHSFTQANGFQPFAVVDRGYGRRKPNRKSAVRSIDHSRMRGVWGSLIEGFCPSLADPIPAFAGRQVCLFPSGECVKDFCRYLPPQGKRTPWLVGGQEFDFANRLFGLSIIRESQRSLSCSLGLPLPAGRLTPSG